VEIGTRASGDRDPGFGEADSDFSGNRGSDFH
jgi:hypothetical protein